MSTAAQARQLQARLLQLASSGSKAERQALLDAMRSVARGSAEPALALACRGALQAVGA